MEPSDVILQRWIEICKDDKFTEVNEYIDNLDYDETYFKQMLVIACEYDASLVFMKMLEFDSFNELFPDIDFMECAVHNGSKYIVIYLSQDSRVDVTRNIREHLDYISSVLQMENKEGLTKSDFAMYKYKLEEILKLFVKDNRIINEVGESYVSYLINKHKLRFPEPKDGRCRHGRGNCEKRGPR